MLIVGSSLWSSRLPNYTTITLGISLIFRLAEKLSPTARSMPTPLFRRPVIHWFRKLKKRVLITIRPLLLLLSSSLCVFSLRVPPPSGWEHDIVTSFLLSYTEILIPMCICSRCTVSMTAPIGCVIFARLFMAYARRLDNSISTLILLLPPLAIADWVI